MNKILIALYYYIIFLNIILLILYLFLIFYLSILFYLIPLINHKTQNFKKN
jgi:hypothetical protein